MKVRELIEELRCSQCAVFDVEKPGDYLIFAG